MTDSNTSTCIGARDAGYTYLHEDGVNYVLISPEREAAMKIAEGAVKARLRDEEEAAGSDKDDIGEDPQPVRGVDPTKFLPKPKTSDTPVFDSPKIMEIINYMNSRYAVIKIGGKMAVLDPYIDGITKRVIYDFLVFDDLKKIYMPDKVEAGYNAKGEPQYKNFAEIWLNHQRRRIYRDGLVFDPSGKTGPTRLNLWQGFAVEPRPGDWSLLKAHMLDNICQGNVEYCDWLTSWLARMIQQPDRQAETTIVLRGREGTGKSILGKSVGKLLGQHALSINNSGHLVGNFNAHLRDVILLQAEEAFFAGDKQAANTLKDVITSDKLHLEAKYIDMVEVPNYLHMIMTSNSEWVVPASLEARRFFVLDVGETQMQNTAYFEAIVAQLEAGGYEAMLHDLQTRDISSFNFRSAPQTSGLIEQRKLSLQPEEKWWLECLHRGYVYKTKLGLENNFMIWYSQLSTELLYESYLQGATKVYEPLGRERFGRVLARMGAMAHRGRNMVVGEHRVQRDGGWVTEPVTLGRAHGFNLGGLSVARDAFCTSTGLSVEWPDDALAVD